MFLPSFTLIQIMKLLSLKIRLKQGWQKFGFGSIRVRTNRTSDKNFLPKPCPNYKSDILIRPGPEPGCLMSGLGCPNVRICDVIFECYNRNFVLSSPNPIIRSCIYKFFQKIRTKITHKPNCPMSEPGCPIVRIYSNPK